MPNKIAANPLPIDANLIRQVTSEFLRTFTGSLIASGLDPVTWITKRHQIPAEAYEQVLTSSYKVKHFDISGLKTLTNVILGLNPHQKSSKTDTGQLMPEYIDEHFGNEYQRVNYLSVVFGEDHIRKWANSLHHAQSLGILSSSDLNDALMDVIQSDFYTIVAHEFTHAVDVVGTSNRLRDEYEKIYDIPDDASPEEIDKSMAFYFTTREELKAHINQTIYEIDEYINKFGPESLYGRSFPEFLDRHSQTYNAMKHHLTVHPGDEETSSLGGSIAKRKRAAWKKYLLTLHSWWERMMQKLQEYLESDMSVRGQRRLARFVRGKVLAKTITKNSFNEA
jgi:hypothetical protein